MIQSSSFISLMKVITAYRDRETARLTKTIYLLPACEASKPTGWHSEIIATFVIHHIYMCTIVQCMGQEQIL